LGGRVRLFFDLQTPTEPSSEGLTQPGPFDPAHGLEADLVLISGFAWSIMPIKYRCPLCHQLLSVSRKQAGRKFPCPACGARTRVPSQQNQEDGPQTQEEGDSPDAMGPDAVLPENPVLREGRRFQEERGDDFDRPFVGEEGGQGVLSSSPKPLKSAEKAVRGSVVSPLEKVELDHNLVENVDRLAKHPHSQMVVSAQMVMSAEKGAFRIKRQIRTDDGMDLTPMVDVTFLLLIFFMITASFSMQKTLEYPKPNPEEKGARQTLTIENLQNDSIMIQIDDRNTITLDGTPVSEPALLAEQLTQLRYTTRRTSVAIDAHLSAMHETVVSVIDAANASGMEHVKLISRKPQQLPR